MVLDINSLKNRCYSKFSNGIIVFFIYQGPEKCREVFELSRFDGRKYSEIAEQLSISVKTVEAHMSKALGILKAELRDYLTILIILILKNQV